MIPQSALQDSRRSAQEHLVEEPTPVAGLLRGVDREARRHVYALAPDDEGEILGELGAVRLVRGPDSTPVWITSLGRVVTDDWRAPVRRPQVSTVLRWTLEPLRWLAEPLTRRTRAVARRGQISVRRLTEPSPRPERIEGPPVGYLEPEGPECWLPLYSASHPITGDQLLSSSPEEIERLGYVDRVLLGHMTASASTTGTLGAPTPPLAWLSWGGEAGNTNGRSPACGSIDRPQPGETVTDISFRVTGWALTPPVPVSRVEISINGSPAGRARLGVPRPDIADPQLHGYDAAAGVCGFEYRAAPHDLPEAGPIRIDALVHRIDGRRFSLPPRAAVLRPAPGPDWGTELRAAGLRERTAGLAPAPASTPAKGVRLLAFTHTLSYGGAQRYFFELLARLSARPGFSCAVVAQGDGPYREKLEALGVPVHLTGEYGGEEADEYEERMLELFSWAAPQGFNLVWANSVDAYFGVDLASRLDLPAAWSIHESFDLAVWWASVYGDGEARAYARERAGLALRRAAAVVFAADATRRQYERHGDPQHYLTCPYGLELDAIARHGEGFDRAAARSRLGIREEATVVLCLGTIEPRKGQVQLAQAFATIAEKHPNALLVMVGDRGDGYSDALRHYVQRVGLADRIRCFPVTSEPYEWHRSADLCVLASDVESSPIVLLEAMACGTPVVATSIFGVPELIEDGRHGYLCEPGDIASLAGTLDRVLGAAPERRREVGLAGAVRVRERHDPDVREAEMRALFEGLAAREDRPAAAIPAAPRRSGGSRAVRERVSVLIPTRDAGPGLERCLDALEAQEGLGGLEVVIVDSGSSDETVAVARSRGVRVDQIPPERFNHGAVRNRLAEMARGDVLVTTVQDATLLSPDALRSLVEELAGDPQLAAVSARQTPGPGADLHSRFQVWLRNETLGSRSGGPGADELERWATSLVDNVCAAIRRPAWEALRFRELDFGEDFDFGLRAHAAGWRTSFSREPRVAHHHDRPASSVLWRSALHRLALARALGNLRRLAPAAAGPAPLLAAIPGLAGELETALGEALSGRAEVGLGQCLATTHSALGRRPGASPPTGELAELCALVGEPLEEAPEAGPALRSDVLGALAFPWLTRFAFRHPEPVPAAAAHTFVARFVASSIGRNVGDAMRDDPDGDLASRLRGARGGPMTVSARGE